MLEILSFLIVGLGALPPLVRGCEFRVCAGLGCPSRAFRSAHTGKGACSEAVEPAAAREKGGIKTIESV